MDRVERCKEKFAELFGGKPVENEGNDPEFMRILQRFIFGEVCYTGSLGNRMRELITISVLTVNQTIPQLKSHIGACLHLKIAPAEIRETIYACAPYIGFPKTLNAIAAMDEVFAENGISLPLENGETVSEENRLEAGEALQKPLYGTEIKERYTWLPGDFAEAVPRWLTELGFGDFGTRRGMSGKDRELLSVVVLAALGGSEVQVRSHAAGALKAGNTGEEIVCALAHAMPYMGIPRFFNALNCAKEVLSE